MRKTGRIIAGLMIAVLLITGPLAGGTLVSASAEMEKYKLTRKNFTRVDSLLERLQLRYDNGYTTLGTKAENLLEKIRQTREEDYRILRAIAEKWEEIFLNRDYRLNLYQEGEERASELEKTGIRDGKDLAFAVLGFQLENGEMTEELKGRCQAAAAAARSFPQAWLICSGGATGSNNPDKHTEAGMMAKYLTEECGMDASRILMDETARTTTENAAHSFAMIREKGISRVLVITSDYHQRRGQLLYAAMAAIEKERAGIQITVTGNYCYQAETRVSARQEAEIALRQVRTMFNLPKAETKK